VSGRRRRRPGWLCCFLVDRAASVDARKGAADAQPALPEDLVAWPGSFSWFAGIAQVLRRAAWWLAGARDPQNRAQMEPVRSRLGAYVLALPLQALKIGVWRMQRFCRHGDRRWIVLSKQTHASRKCFKPGMSARLTLANCARKNVWRRRRRTCLTVCDIEAEIGALVAPVGIARGFKRESRSLTEMDK
jgi:hypothetical protein